MQHLLASGLSRQFARYKWKTFQPLRRHIANSTLQLLCAGMLLAAHPIDAKAANSSSVQFDGVVIGNGKAEIQVKQTSINAFGDEAGVILRNFNGTAETTAMSFAVFDSNRKQVRSSIVGAPRSIHAGGMTEHIIVIPLNKRHLQNFTLCAKQKSRSGIAVAEACFDLAVARH